VNGAHASLTGRVPSPNPSRKREGESMGQISPVMRTGVA
jgi:hypothetical protein